MGHFRSVTSPVIAYLYLFTALATPTYWILVSMGLLGQSDLAAWLARFPYVSPLADLWMGGTSLACYLYWKKTSPLAFPAGIAASSAMVFVALTAFTFHVVHPPQRVGFAEITELAVPVYLFVFGLAGFIHLSRPLAASTDKGLAERGT